MIVVGLFLFSLQDVIIKSFSDRYSVLQIVFIRGIIALLLISVVVTITSGLRGFIAHSPGLLLLKGLCGFLSYLCYYLAIASLPLAEVVTIVFTAPIFVTVLSALLLKENVGPRRWTAVAIGFLGVIIAAGPAGHVGNVAVVLALLAAITYSCYTIITRFIGPNDRPWTVSLYSMVVFFLGSIVASLAVSFVGGDIVTESPALQFLIRPWVLPSTTDLLLMVFLGANAAAGFYCLVKAYWVAPASLIAPFEYTYIIWAVLFGYLIWSEVPKPTTVVGVVLLIGSSLYVFRREIHIQRAQREDVSDQSDVPANRNELSLPDTQSATLQPLPRVDLTPSEKQSA